MKGQRKMKHHEYGPSNYPAWSECPCFRSSHSESSASTEGTDAHAELARALTEPEYIPSNYAARWAAAWIEENRDEAESVGSEIQLKGYSEGPLCGIFGTADAIWCSPNTDYHIADLKTFSDGTVDYMPQLKGYAALVFKDIARDIDSVVHLHVLHGGVCKAESADFTFRKCIEDTIDLLKKAQDTNAEPCLCKWCQFCSKIKECKMTNNALTTVSENLPSFSSLSTCQKLVVLDAVDKLSKTIREEAKKEAKENGGYIEQDGIRYEFRPWAGPSKCRDICEVAGAMSDKMTVDKKTRKDVIPTEVNGIGNEDLLKACTLSKTALVSAMMSANPGSALTKADWERWADKFYEKTEGAPHFVRAV